LGETTFIFNFEFLTNVSLFSKMKVIFGSSTKIILQESPIMLIFLKGSERGAFEPCTSCGTGFASRFFRNLLCLV